MRISARGIDLIKQFEGLELEAYQDIADIWTIGYGHTGPDVEPGMVITEEEAEDLLRRDLGPRERAVASLSNVNLNQNEFDALVSFIYNVGEAAFRGSTARRRLNRDDRMGAADALTWWNKATVNGVLREVTGLTRRRAAERALFLSPAEPVSARDRSSVDQDSRIRPIEDSPRRSNPSESRTVQGAVVAGGAGVAASSMGLDTAQELDQVESDIEAGLGTNLLAPADETETPTGDTSDETPGEAITLDPGPATPSARDVHAVEAQVQLALLILIVLAVGFVIVARIDDWLNHRR